MKLAFATGAVASGLVGAGITGIVIWLVTLVTASSEPWSAAPTLVVAVAALVGAATYFAERTVYRRSVERRRAVGEPWAYRTD